MAPRIDNFTLLVLIGPMNLLIPVLAWLVLRRYERTTLTAWCAGCLLITSGLMLSALQGTAPDWVARECSMLAQSAGMILLVISLRMHLGLTAGWRLLAIIPPAFALVVLGLDLGEQVAARQLVILIHFIAIDTWVAILAYRVARLHHSIGAGLICTGMFITMAGTLLRLVFIVIGATQPFSLSGSWNVVVGILGILIALTLCNLGYFAFAIERLNGKLLARGRQYEFLTENMHDNVWIINTDTMRFTYVSPAIFRMRGFTVEEAMSGKVGDLLPDADRSRVLALIQERLADFMKAGPGEPRYYIDELLQPCKNGTTIWTEIVTHFVRDAETGRIELWGVTRDISTRKKYEQEIERHAFYDALTNLPNRRLLFDRLNRIRAESARSNRYAAALFIDLDRFKLINDELGHAAGDAVLVEAARRIGTCLREADTLARMGGDEFVALVRDLQESHDPSEAIARGIALKIQAQLDHPFAIDLDRPGQLATRVERRCSASIGIALFNGQTEDADAVIERADAAMYAAKTAGRNIITKTEMMSGKHHHVHSF